MTTLVLFVIGGLVGSGVGWGLARLTQHQIPRPGDEHHNWLLRSPTTPILLLVAIILPFLELATALEGLIFALLMLPPTFIFGLRYAFAAVADELQTTINRREVVRTGWRDMAIVGFTYLVFRLIYTGLPTSWRDSVYDHLDHLPPAIVLALVVGSALGLALYVGHQQVIAAIARRHRNKMYSQWVDGPIEMFQSFIEGLLTQFHGKRLTGVLVIATAVLPFLDTGQTILLTVLLIPPVVSAVLAARLVTEPIPGMPDSWIHLRTGLTNMMQISVGYMVGAAAIVPLDNVRDWGQANTDTVNTAFNTHLELTFIALGISLAIGIGGGILSTRNELLHGTLINLGNTARTLPSLAVLALALPILGKVGREPTLVALVFIGALPILVNTYVGIAEVSSDIKESARGMGMNDRQVLLRVEIPIAIPVIMAGIRTSAVLVVASATLAGFIGGGGLGDLIIQGDAVGIEEMLMAGAILSTVLAIFLEYFFGWLETLLTPRGLRGV